MGGLVRIERERGVTIVALDRPEARNALSLGLLLELRRAIKALAQEAETRCIVLTGRGGSFSSGADFREWDELNRGINPFPDHDWVEEAIKLIQDVAALPKPTIAMIDGAAAGAGLDLALACDFRYASSRAKFICAYTRLGLPPDCGGTWFLPRIIGPEAAKRLVFTGEAWDAQTALSCGLVSDVVPPETLLEHTMEFGRRLAAGPTVAIGLAKKLIDSAFSRSLGEQQIEEQASGRACLATRDHIEGLAAANERRDPQFVGS